MFPFKMSSARYAPSKQILENNDEQEKGVLNRLILGSKDVAAGNDVEDIKKFAYKLKEQRRKYIDANRAHSLWYKERGSLEMAGEIINERIVLNEDLDLVLKLINKSIAELDAEAELVSQLSPFSPAPSIINSQEGACGGQTDKSMNYHPEVRSSAPIDVDLLGAGIGLNDFDRLCISDEVTNVKKSQDLPLSNLVNSTANPPARNFHNPSRIANPVIDPNLFSMPNRIDMQDRAEFNQFLPNNSGVRPKVQSVQFPAPNNYWKSRSQNHLPNSANVLPSHNSQNENSDYVQEGGMSEVARQYLKLDLLKGQGEKFDGSPYKFWSWYGYINARIVEANLFPIDVLHVLKANTTGPPLRYISHHLDAGVPNPSRVVSDIWATFKKRYGSDSQVSANLRDQLDSISKIEIAHDVEKIDHLFGVCRVIRSNIDRCPSLKIFLLPDGMKKIWEKMPDNFISRWQRSYVEIENSSGCPPSLDDLLNKISFFIDEFSNVNFKKPVAPQRKARVLKTEASSQPPRSEVPSCIYGGHETSEHSTHDCRKFAQLENDAKRRLASKYRLCYRCLGNHLANSCHFDGRCDFCSKNHCTAMHYYGTEENPEYASEENA